MKSNPFILSAMLLSVLAHGASLDPTVFEAEIIARKVLKARDAEAVLSGCDFSNLASTGKFYCFSKNIGPRAACDDGSRSAPFWIMEGYLDVELQPQIGKIFFREACSEQGQ